jgi:protein-disulfide isomerase
MVRSMDTSTSGHAAQCPDANNVAGFIDGRLNARNRRAFIEHLAGCERCHFTFVQSIAVLDEGVPEPSAPRSWRHVAVRIVALTAAAALVVGVRAGLRVVQAGRHDAAKQAVGEIDGRRDVEDADEVRGARAEEPPTSERAQPQVRSAGETQVAVDVRTPNPGSEFERWYSASNAVPFDQWYRSQPRLRIDEASGDPSPVVIVMFNDFQCRLCAEAYLAYKPIVAKYEARQPGVVRLVLKDYPLNHGCNDAVPGATHPLACEAAVAARLVPENRRVAMAEWLYTHQASMTGASLRQAAQDIGGITNFDRDYLSGLTHIRTDVTLGRELFVESAPTLFINGVRIVPVLPPRYLELAIAEELSPSHRIPYQPTPRRELEMRLGELTHTVPHRR